VPALDSDTRGDAAGLVRRFFAGVLDLFLLALMVAPAAAAIQFSNADWTNPRVIGVMAGITAVVMFIFITISIGLTGRTLGMRLVGLRAIDIQTGLIPSGGQAAKRGLAYVFSFACLGLGLAYAIIDPDGRAAHDRFSKTMVIRG